MRRTQLVQLALPLLLLAPILAPPGAAQEREIEKAGLPRNTADRLLGIVNDPATLKLPGESHLPADSVLRSHVVIMGDFRLAGRVEGDLIVIHGDLDIEPGAVVRGDLTVVDGEVRGSAGATIDGTLIAYQRESRFVQRGERARHVAPGPRRLARDVPAGSSFRFSVRGGDYNRVEGLPVHVGPMLDTGGRNPLRAQTHLIWRSEGQVPLGADRLGYQATAEQFLGGQRALRVGAGVHSMIDPIEAWGLSDRENAWSTFLLTTDHRDHFERRGWSAFVRATPREWPVDARLELRSERHGSVGAADPWSLFHSGRAWRPQPLAAEGSLESMVAGLEIDTRDDHREPLDGWLVRIQWRQGIGGSLELPPATRWSSEAGEEGASGPPHLGPEIDERFATALLDVRRYHPIGRGAGLAIRGVFGGSPWGDALPPQYQHALGGAGSLPGHSRFAVDCGARSSQVTVDHEGAGLQMFPFYGCDQMALLQVEYRGPLNLDVGFGPSKASDWGRGAWRHSGPSWAVFFNAGRGWAAGEWGDLPRSPSPALYDAGLGLLLGEGGVYWAMPLGGSVRGSTFTVRLDRRF